MVFLRGKWRELKYTKTASLAHFLPDTFGPKAKNAYVCPTPGMLVGPVCPSLFLVSAFPGKGKAGDLERVAVDLGGCFPHKGYCLHLSPFLAKHIYCAASDENNNGTNDHQLPLLWGGGPQHALQTWSLMPVPFLLH